MIHYFHFFKFNFSIVKNLIFSVGLLCCIILFSNSILIAANNDFDYKQNYSLDPQRILVPFDTTVTIQNIGSAVKSLKTIKFIDNNDFTIIDHDKDKIASNEKLSIKIGFTPTKEFTQTNTLIVVFESLDTLKITFSAYGFIPKIKDESYTFPYQKVNSKSKLNYFKIQNPSQTSDLYISKITIRNNPNFSFDDNTFIKEDLTVPKGSEINIGMYFYPKSTGKLYTDLLVISDAAEGPSKKPRNYDTLRLYGEAFQPTYYMDLGRFLLCEVRDTIIAIDNTSIDKQMTIDSLKVDGPYDFTYQILDKSVEPGLTGFVRIFLQPKQCGVTSNVLNVFTSNGILEIPVKADVYQLNTELKILDYSDGKSLIVPGQVITVPIRYKYDYYGSVDTLVIRLKYNPFIMDPISADNEVNLQILKPGECLLKFLMKKQHCL